MSEQNSNKISDFAFFLDIYLLKWQTFFDKIWIRL